MMQLSIERETTLSWRVVGPFTEPFLVVDVLCYVLPFILRRLLCFFCYLWFLFVCFLFLLAFTNSMLISPILHLIRPKDSAQSLTPTLSKALFFIRHNNDFTPESEH